MTDQLSDTSALLKIDAQLYDIDCVKRAAYKLPSHFSAELSRPDNSIIECRIHSTLPLSEEAWRSALVAFRRELTDQDLRKKVSAETEVYRNVILGLAFSKTGLQRDE